jgi:geranylgeranyl pyrophosphate synthase
MAAGITDLRFDEMRATSAHMLEELTLLKQILSRHEVFAGQSLTEYCTEYLELKVGGYGSKNLPLRAYYARKMYEYLRFEQGNTTGNKTAAHKLFTQKIPFVFETIITIQYLHNQILDEKLDTNVRNHPQVNRRLLSSNILREALFIYMESEVRPLLKKIRMTRAFPAFQAEIRKLLLWVDIGQYTDKTFNHYEKWKEGLPEILHNPDLMDPLAQSLMQPYIAEVKQEIPGHSTFIDGYFQRIYLSNVYFFQSITESIALLLPVDAAKTLPMQQFSILYGYMLQIINDYADFAYSENQSDQKNLETAGKNSDDIYADLYNFNVTLPLIYHLPQKNNRKIESYLDGGRRGRKVLREFPRQIFEEIKESGLYPAIALSRTLSKAASNCLNERNPASPFLNNMCEIAMMNKFYKQITGLNK